MYLFAFLLQVNLFSYKFYLSIENAEECCLFLPLFKFLISGSCFNIKYFSSSSSSSSFQVLGQIGLLQVLQNNHSITDRYRSVAEIMICLLLFLPPYQAVQCSSNTLDTGSTHFEFQLYYHLSWLRFFCGFSKWLLEKYLQIVSLNLGMNLSCHVATTESVLHHSFIHSCAPIYLFPAGGLISCLTLISCWWRRKRCQRSGNGELI